MNTDIINELAEIFRTAVLHHINDISIDKGLGSPESYYVVVKQKNIDASGNGQISLDISGSTSKYGIVSPLYRYIIDRIGFEKWNQDISDKVYKMMKKVNMIFQIDIQTIIEPMQFEVVMNVR